jgi:hypothetical protein
MSTESGTKREEKVPEGDVKQLLPFGDEKQGNETTFPEEILGYFKRC